MSYQAECEAIDLRFRRQLAGLRQRFREWEIPAAMRALQDERYLALRQVRERRALEAHAARQARRRRLPPPPAP